MIKKFNNWETTKAFGSFQALPKGAYICKIMKAEVIGDWGIKVYYDVTEGDHKDFWSNDYRSQTREDKIWRGTFLLYLPTEDGSPKDENTKRRFRTFTDHLEDVNPGYHFDWDEQKWKGKMFGGLFRIRQSQKNDKVYNNLEPNAFTSFENIRNGNYTLPDDYMISNNTTTQTSPGNTGFTDVEGSNDLPF